MFARPADIVLLLDHSSSMRPPKLADAQAAANVLIDTVTAASGGTTAIKDGSRIGIVGFSSTAKILLDFSTDTAALHSAIHSLACEGATDHRRAFETAESMLTPDSEKRQIVIIFTDSATSVGGDPGPVTRRIKASGAEIYGIGLLSDNTNLNKWAKWASAPLDTHVAVTKDSARLIDLFRQIASEIVLAGAYDAALH